MVKSPRIRALVVEDSVTVRRKLVEVLSADPGIEVIGEAADGAVAIEMCARLRPDVMTIDMVLPTLSGLAATEYIMAYCPTPILIVSASFNRGSLFRTYDALAAGAVEVLEKPTGNEMAGDWEHRLIANLKLASRINVITHPRAKLDRRSGSRLANGAFHDGGPEYRLVAIGASTGGPAAIVEILRHLPRSFRLPIIVLLHIGKPFGLALAEWLESQTSLPVSHATDGASLPHPGRAQVILAPADYHLRVDFGRFRLTSDGERHSCRPSIDVLFESLAGDGAARSTIACLLTGMGRDGAQGLLELRRAGAMTIVQDEASSVVFGMPCEAIKLGAAHQVLPITEIAAAVSSLVPDRVPVTRDLRDK